MNAAVSVEGVSKRFRVYHERNQTLKSAIMRRRRAVYEDFWALRDVSFEIPAGRTFALVGDNGSGKSTLLKTLAQILYPDEGTVRVNGRVAALLEVGSGFHPELSGRENVYLNGSILGMTRTEIERKFDDIVGFSGVEDFIDQPVKNYSSGMYVRLGFSVAINVDPEILLVDEVLAVGDAAFQDKCAEKFADFRREGRTVVVVSHSMPSLRAMADQVAWLDHGSLVRTGDAGTVLEEYLDSTRQGVRVDESGRVRWGSGEARIDRVDVVSGGRTTDVVRSLAPVTLRVHYTADEAIPNPVFGLAIESHDGVYLWANNTRDQGWHTPRIAGSGVLECQVPALALQPGGFSVLASVVDETTTHVYDYLRDAARFQVTHGDLHESGGFVALDGRWSAPGEGAS
ncbi:ABC transporter ATP-binding protein [Isoptericola sp. b441]|uniref:ABC transporter ATP-binding protein n=1 Tax=Actinotalea lenta TaxID=3064654 RepID=A0ABT9DF43_9CELL|nr:MULTISPECIES: ABC transporter ATP-binding protein [unclassified Isoptericola]MDO8108551.1 ABC transporter ATP-binding protein [Isoptericola sp. b441]MDO8119961.1 ABC transporter ATP-binding protein [Isoptericola sp. b490]